MFLDVQQLEYYKERALARIKQLNRHILSASSTDFHNALHWLRKAFYENSNLWPQREKLDGIVDALQQYPQALRDALDARDELNDILATIRSLRILDSIEQPKEKNEKENQSQEA